MMTEYWIDDNGSRRKMTAEEISEVNQLQERVPQPEPTADERIAALQKQVDDLTLLLADMIGSNTTGTKQ